MRVVREEETEGEITVEVRYRGESAPCPGCGQRTPKVHSTRQQQKRDRGLWDKPVSLVLHKRRVRCLACRRVFSEPDPVFGARRRSSQRFREHLGQEALHQTVRHVAHKGGVGESLVRHFVTEEAKRLLGVPEKPPPARILGLDEFSIKKGQVYDTAIMDMHEPFRQAAEWCLPQAKVVVDKFHVLMHVNRALDQVRTSLQPPKGAVLRCVIAILLSPNPPKEGVGSVS